MSVQTNQYLMYGIMKPYSFVKQWEEEKQKDFYDTFEEFCDDSAYKPEVIHKDGIFCLFDGMNGKFIIIGRVIHKTTDDDPFMASGYPITFADFTPLEKELITNSIRRNFNIEGELKHYFVTHYR